MNFWARMLCLGAVWLGAVWPGAALTVNGWGQAPPAATSPAARPPAGTSQTGNTGLDTPAAQGDGDRSALAGSGKAGKVAAAGSAVGEAPLDSPAVPGAGDQSALASPVTPLPRGSAIAAGTEIKMVLGQAVNSGAQMNGDRIYGTLAEPVRTSAGTVLPQGAPVEGTVVSAARAGLVASGGILSLQLTRVGGVPIISDVVDFNGQEGHKDVADSAPAKGTEAAVTSGTTLDFHVMLDGKATGLVPGVPPATNAGGNSNGNSGSAPDQGPGIPQTPIHGATQGVTPH